MKTSTLAVCLLASVTAVTAVRATVFGAGDVPVCHVDQAGRTVVHYSDDHPLHESFLCTHQGGRCECKAHPTHHHGKCRQFHHTDGSKHTVGGDCVTPTTAAPAPTPAPTKGFCYNGDCSYELIAKTMGGGYFKADAASNKYVSAACSESSTTSCVNPDFAAADLQLTDIVEDIHVSDGTVRQHHYAWGGQNLHQMRIVQATGKSAHHYKLKLFVGNFKPSGYTSPSHQGCGNSGTNYPGAIGTAGLHFEWQSYYNCGGHDGVYGAQGHWPQCAACGSNYRTYGQFSTTFYEGGRGKAATSYLYAKKKTSTPVSAWYTETRQQSRCVGKIANKVECEAAAVLGNLKTRAAIEGSYDTVAHGCIYSPGGQLYWNTYNSAKEAGAAPYNFWSICRTEQYGK